MQITIHRGINQIGGCITEIAAGTTRICIDLGHNLPDHNDDHLANEDSIQSLTQGIDAIFYTHYHGDHIDLFHFVPNGVEQYIGGNAKKVIARKYQQLSKLPEEGAKYINHMVAIERMNPLKEGRSIRIKDIKVTPFFVSHSAYESYMFLVEAEGKRILHTGDFRNHGYLGKGLNAILKRLITHKHIDLLITEGTMLSRIGERVLTEAELKEKAIGIMTAHKNVFVLCSSTDMERLASYYAANKTFKNRPFICDEYQKDTLGIFSESAGKKSSLFNFKKLYTFHPSNQKLMDWMKEEGFCMLVRPTSKFIGYINHINTLIPASETVLVYSMWKEYINPGGKHVKEDHLSFIEHFGKYEQLHTSGHATTDCLAEVCNLINPTIGIIPIHSEKSENFKHLKLSEELKGKILTSSQVVKDMKITIKQ